MTAPLRVLVDCDPGHDDALALAVLCAHSDVVGVTTVAGNVTVQRTTDNALRILDLLGRPEIEVHAGAEASLRGETHTATNIHGESGLAGAELPPASRMANSADAVAFLTATIHRESAAGANDGVGVWLVVTGPMTNVALAMDADPKLVDRVAGLSFMGGSTHVGNWSSVAEFNIWADPEAADVVIRALTDAGKPIIMAGLNVTHKFQATPSRVARVASGASRPSKVFGALLDEFSDRYRARQHDVDGAPMHDVLAALALTHPHVFTSIEARLDIETVGAHTRGMTVVDQRGFREMRAPNCCVLTDVDADAAFDVVVDCLERAGVAMDGTP